LDAPAIRPEYFAPRFHCSHTARTSAFTHACAAFSFVTLPSLDETGTALSALLGVSSVWPCSISAMDSSTTWRQRQLVSRRSNSISADDCAIFDLALLCGLADHCDLTAPDTAALFGQLWQLTAASIDGGGDVQQARATLAQLRDRAAEWPEVAAAIRAT
uniref:SopA_C domain-containing protein n=1 Tax=Macrostomum lignano TaxID=282301 RepID=A0A1I8JQS3_9PLAT